MVVARAGGGRPGKDDEGCRNRDGARENTSIHRPPGPFCFSSTGVLGSGTPGRRGTEEKPEPPEGGRCRSPSFSYRPVSDPFWGPESLTPLGPEGHPLSHVRDSTHLPSGPGVETSPVRSGHRRDPSRPV